MVYLLVMDKGCAKSVDLFAHSTDRDPQGRARLLITGCPPDVIFVR